MAGGRHPGEGTRNAIIRIGDSMYLELIASDPDQPGPPRPRWFGLDDLTASRLVTWAAKAADLDRRVAAARAGGLELGDVRSGRRELDGGGVLWWRLTYPNVRLGAGLVPFLIDWGESPHPASTAPGGVELVALRGAHPDPASITGLVRQLGIELEVVPAASAELIATLETPRGWLELR